MNPDKDYYRILGVLDDAEDVVIKAAYRALAQRYHPDKWQGDAAEATRRMADINAAFAVLSDPGKRATYDSRRDKSEFREEPPEYEDANEAINRDWELATKYLPDLKRMERELHKISRELAFTFRLTLLESKRFSESGAIAGILEKNFLRKYFGDEPEVQAFAKELILEGRKDAAMELNEVVRVIGRVDQQVLDQIVLTFKPIRYLHKVWRSEFKALFPYALSDEICDVLFELRAKGLKFFREGSAVICSRENSSSKSYLYEDKLLEGVNFLSRFAK
jgi:hypothetical protein